ncbi:MAG: sugar transferase [Lentimicrobiaceae bacterium]|jgi:lipopolysaccharide/colanic/teichoic acid biosynthesis glycosyltransferase
MIRFFDIILSFFGIIIVSPILIIASIILFITGHKIFFTQIRVGQGNKHFKVIKFTTMSENAERIDFNNISFENDTRYFSFGKILNKTKINELPQLFNIILGDMSFIGPRPLVPETFYNYYTKEAQDTIIKIKPGLSGISSVVFRDEDIIRSKTTLSNEDFARQYLFPYKGEIEKWQVINHTLKNYFLLIILTIIAILFPKNQFHKKLFKNLPAPPKTIQSLL